MSLLHWLARVDRRIFVLIHHDASNALLDTVMPVLREPLTWIPLYAFVLYYAIRKGKNRAWLFILLGLLTVACTDSVASWILKPLFHRLRPCHEPALQSIIRDLAGCGGMYSMPSNHAANHFGLAAFWYGSIRVMTGKKWGWLWIWALLICYAQVYVGKHYPFDILAGALLGCLAGLISGRLFARYWNGMAPKPLPGQDIGAPPKT
jgi:membrane-associated phospholipid phosphatase